MLEESVSVFHPAKHGHPVPSEQAGFADVFLWTKHGVGAVTTQFVSKYGWSNYHFPGNFSHGQTLFGK